MEEDATKLVTGYFARPPTDYPSEELGIDLRSYKDSSNIENCCGNFYLLNLGYWAIKPVPSDHNKFNLAGN